VIGSDSTGGEASETSPRRMSFPARVYLTGAALTGAAHTVVYILLVRYLDAIGLSDSQIGWIQSADAWGKVAVALPAAVILARRPARGVFVLSATVGGLAYAVLPWVEDLRLLYAVNLVAGFALTLQYVAIAPFLFRHSTSRDRARLFGLAEALPTLAAVVAAVVAGRLVMHWQGPLGGEAAATGRVIFGGGMLSLLAAAIFARIPMERPAVEKGSGLWPVFLQNRGVLARFAMPQFLIACGSGLCIPFMPLYFKDRFGMGPGDWGNLFAAGQVLFAAGFMLTPFVIRRLGYVRGIVSIELASIPFFLLLAFTWSLPWAIVAFLVRGALMNSAYPILKNLMMQATPPGAREMQTGMNAALWGVGWVVGPLAAGHILEATGGNYSILMTATVVLYVAAAILSNLLLTPVERRLVLEKASELTAEV
jgi:MFS family permease